MARYFARVELHEADDEDYENLHKLLKKEGFSHCIALTSGASKKLPTGFYVATLTESKVSVVSSKVRKRANETLCENEVIVVKSDGSSSYLSEGCK